MAGEAEGRGWRQVVHWRERQGLGGCHQVFLTSQPVALLFWSHVLLKPSCQGECGRQGGILESGTLAAGLCSGLQKEIQLLPRFLFFFLFILTLMTQYKSMDQLSEISRK